MNTYSPFLPKKQNRNSLGDEMSVPKCSWILSRGRHRVISDSNRLLQSFQSNSNNNNFKNHGCNTIAMVTEQK